MLPSMTASSSGHWNHEGSRRWQRSMLPSASDAGPRPAHRRESPRPAPRLRACPSPAVASGEFRIGPDGSCSQDLVDDRHALLDLADADPDAGIHVAVLEHRHFELQLIVRRIARRASRVEAPSRSPADVASRPELSRQRRRQDSGADRAVLQRSGVVVELDELGKVRANVSDERSRSPVARPPARSQAHSARARCDPS